jgi:hypothetical protein
MHDSRQRNFVTASPRRNERRLPCWRAREKRRASSIGGTPASPSLAPWLSGEQVKMVRRPAVQLCAPCSGRAGGQRQPAAGVYGFHWEHGCHSSSMDQPRVQPAPMPALRCALDAPAGSKALLADFGCSRDDMDQFIAGRRPQGRWPQQEGPQDCPQEREPLCEAAGEGEPSFCAIWSVSGGLDAGQGWAGMDELSAEPGARQA